MPPSPEPHVHINIVGQGFHSTRVGVPRRKPLEKKLVLGHECAPDTRISILGEGHVRLCEASKSTRTISASFSRSSYRNVFLCGRRGRGFVFDWVCVPNIKIVVL